MGTPGSDGGQLQGPGEDRGLDIEILKLAAEHFRHDLRMFWEHSAFFVVVDGALFSVYASTVASDAPDYWLARSCVAAGICLTAFWWWVAHVRADLIRLWREQVVRVDKAVDPHQIYVEVEKYVQQHPVRSPTNVAKYLPALVLAGWAVALGASLL